MNYLSKQELLLKEKKTNNESDSNINLKEELSYDQFYQLKHNNENLRKKKKIHNLKFFEYASSRLKKEREKMIGHKCELCQNFYNVIEENNDHFCQECSKHRTNEKINYTPKSFYDLSI